MLIEEIELHCLKMVFYQLISLLHCNKLQICCFQIWNLLDPDPLYQVFSYRPCVKESPNREKTIFGNLIFWPWENSLLWKDNSAAHNNFLFFCGKGFVKLLHNTITIVSALRALATWELLLREMKSSIESVLSATRSLAFVQNEFKSTFTFIPLLLPTHPAHFKRITIYHKSYGQTHTRFIYRL